MDTAVLQYLVSPLLAASVGVFVARRAASRSAGRLRADLEILKQALELGLPDDEIDAIRYRVRSAVRWHTRSSWKPGMLQPLALPDGRPPHLHPARRDVA